MLPEPDLFASVHTSTHNDDEEERDNELPSQDMQLVCNSIHSRELLPHSRELLPHCRRVLPHCRRVLPHSKSVARRWYLVVIVMLYVGLITSFCLNITLLVRTPDTPSHQTFRTGNKPNNFSL